MRIENHTPLPIQLFRNAEDGDQITAFVLCALTCDIIGGRLEVAKEQRPLETDPRLPHPHDAMWLKERAASVCATGFVYPPGEEGVEAEASVAVGERIVRVVAIGRRVWRRGLAGRMVPTAPLPFDRVAMQWSHAFGGRFQRPWTVQRLEGEEVMVPGHESHFPDNPDGAGFYLSAEDADEKALPLLEDPEHRVARVDDWPRPRCFAPYPLEGAMRADLILRDGTEVVREELPRLASRAMPALTFDALEPGMPVWLSGMRPGGAGFGFALPAAPLSVEVSVGADRAVLSPRLDSVDIDAEAAQARFVFRAPFGYDLVRRERRAVVVAPTPAFEAMLSA